MGFHRSGWGSFLRYDEEQDRPKISRDLLLRVARYARPYWKPAALLMTTIAVSSLFALIPPLLTRELIDTAIPNRDFTLLNWLALAMVAIAIITRLLSVGQGYLSARVGEGLTSDLRRSLYAHLQRMSLRFFTHTRTGEIMSRINSDVSGAQRAVTGALVNLVNNVISLVTTLIVMISIDWRLTLIGIVILPLLLLPARRVGKILRDVTREYMTTNAEMNALMNETLNVSGALLVKIFGRTQDEVTRFSERAGEIRDIGIRRAMIGRWFSIGLGLASALGTALVFWAGGHLVLRGTFTIGTIIAFSSYLRQLYGPLTALANARVEFATSLVSFERVFEVLDLPVEIEDRPDAVELDPAFGHVRFAGVWFRYEDIGPMSEGATLGLQDVERYGRRGAASSLNVTKSGRLRSDGGSRATAEPSLVVDEGLESGVPGVESEAVPAQPMRTWALRNINLVIEPGHLAALVGPSGAGKTTITYLLPRLYDPTEGNIYLDGYDLRDIKLTSLAELIGMVTQETYLFHDTIRANLLYAWPEATQEDLEEACRAANIHDFITSLHDGYDTVVGERGYRLSGGEKQRVAIARVILKDPRVLILDEATSHLDSESEALIQEALERVMWGRTSLVIAHRLSTILSADVIFVLDEGRIIQRGTHEELMTEPGLYRQLYERQFAVNETEPRGPLVSSIRESRDSADAPAEWSGPLGGGQREEEESDTEMLVVTEAVDDTHDAARSQRTVADEAVVEELTVEDGEAESVLELPDDARGSSQRLPGRVVPPVQFPLGARAEGPTPPTAVELAREVLPAELQVRMDLHTLPAPLSNAYWVVPGRFLAGPYPGNVDAEIAQEKIDLLLGAGVTLFLDLTEPGEAAPYAYLLKGRARHDRLAIPDFDVPNDAHMVRLLDTIDREVARDRCVYLHCYAGLGRTGTVVGAYLVRHGLTGQEALEAIRTLRRQTEFADSASPQTDTQRRMVRGWSG